MAFQTIARTYVLSLALVAQILVPSSTAPAPPGMLMAPNVDPFAHPPPPQYSGNYVFAAPPPPMPALGSFPPQPQQQQAVYNYAQPPPPPYNQPYQHHPANMINPPPLPPVHNNPPIPANAARLGETAPRSSGAEQEFEADRGGAPAGSSSVGQPFYYQPQHSAVGGQGMAYYGQQPSHSLLDTYYHRPQPGYHGYAQPQPRRQNDMFGGLFGGTPSGNLFGALMMNELMF